MAASNRQSRTNYSTEQMEGQVIEMLLLHHYIYKNEVNLKMEHFWVSLAVIYFTSLAASK